MESYKSPLFEKLIQEVSSSGELDLIEKKMSLAARIEDTLLAKGIKKSSFAQAMSKQPSEISKWLSGTHNFTIETLWQIERELCIDLIKWKDSIPVYLKFNNSTRNDFVISEVVKMSSHYYNVYTQPVIATKRENQDDESNNYALSA